MTFVEAELRKESELYVTLEDIPVLSGTFLKGTILKKIGEDPVRGLDFIDFEGNKLLETGFFLKNIVPIEKAYKLFEPKAVNPKDL